MLRNKVKIIFSVRVLLWVTHILSLGMIFAYGNHLMINRPYLRNYELGYLYPFQGKAHMIYTSALDYVIIILSVVGVLISAVCLNRLHSAPSLSAVIFER